MPAVSLPVLLRALAVWLLVIAAESVQGGARRLLTSEGADFAARQGGVVLGTFVIFIITWLSLRWMRLRTTTGALGVGVLWALLTLAFELGLGRAMGLSWGRIAEDYDLVHGGLMPAGLVAMALAPLAALWAQRRAGR